jgi:hypothetical protein
MATLFGIQFRGEDQFRHANHAIHGSTNLVAHVGEELAFGAAGGFRRFLGFGEFRVHF